MKFQYSCCGIDNYDEWHFKYPESCFCKKDSPNCIEKDDRDPAIFDQGCFSKLHIYLELHDAIAGIGITVALLEVCILECYCGLIFALILYFLTKQVLCVVCSVALIASFTLGTDQTQTLPVPQTNSIDSITTSVI